MADGILRSRHTFGTSAGLEQALAEAKIDEYDILFLSDPDGNKVGWIDKNGNVHMVEPGLKEAEVTAMLDAAIKESKEYADKMVDEVVEEKVSGAMDTKVSESIASALEAYTAEKFEITNVPEGTLVDYSDHEVKIMIPKDAVFAKQNVGTGGDPNCYYITLKTYFTDDEIVGYKEHLGNQSDAEILKDIKVDANGRRYQPTWLGVAKFDNATGAWNYYGANSTEGKFIGWDYRIDKFNANDVMIASDSIRINLSNEECHFSITPSYVNGAINEANAYTDMKIAEVASGYEIVEF